MNNAQYAKLLAYLAKHGLRGKEAKAFLGDKPNGRSNKKIVEDLKQWLKSKPSN